MMGFFLLASCEGQKEHTAPAVHDRDSASMMISYGVNTLISDSGVIKYRIVTERWEVNTVRNPSRWILRKVCSSSSLMRNSMSSRTFSAIQRIITTKRNFGSCVAASQY